MYGCGVVWMSRWFDRWCVRGWLEFMLCGWIVEWVAQVGECLFTLGLIWYICIDNIWRFASFFYQFHKSSPWISIAMTIPFITTIISSHVSAFYLGSFYQLQHWKGWKFILKNQMPKDVSKLILLYEFKFNFLYTFKFFSFSFHRFFFILSVYWMQVNK